MTSLKTDKVIITCDFDIHVDNNNDNFSTAFMSLLDSNVATCPAFPGIVLFCSLSRKISKFSRDTKCPGF